MSTSSMLSSSFRARRALLCVLVLVIAACATGGRPPASQSTSAGVAATTAPSSAAPSAAVESALPVYEPDAEFPLKPPDGRWLVDESGNHYFIVRIHRIEGGYVFVDEHTVRLRYGMTLKLERYDDNTFYAKIFRVEAADQPPAVPGAISEQERVRVAATYVVKLPVAPALPLSPFDDGLPQAGQWRDGFAIADMNEDGRPDLVHAPPRKALGSPPVIYLGDGAGHWRPWSEARFPADLTYDYGDVAVADFDHDGHLDMALAMHVIGMNVLLGDGKGSFRDASTGIEPSAGAKENRFTSRAVRALDWDGDGWPDLVALGEGMSLIVGGSGPPKPLQGGLGIAVYRNLHDGRWERAALLDSVVHGNTMAFGDFDGDGRRDLVVAASVLGLRRLVYLGKEAGRWEERELDVRPRAFITAVTTGDLDGDHRDDIALSYVGVEGDEARSGIDLFLSHTAGGELTWQRQGLAVMPGRDGYTALTIGDLDGDGRNEVIVLDGSGGLQTFLGKGGGKFAAAAKAPIPPPLGGCAGYDVQLQDLDGDGRPELVAEFAGEEGSAAVLAMVIGPQPSCRSNGAIRAWKLTAEPAR